MKRQFVLFAGLFIMTASQALAVVKTELFLDAGGGTTATVDVSDLGIVTCTGTCGGLVFPSFLAPHTTLMVTGSLGQFTIDATGVGGLNASAPTLQDLNQIEAASTGPGTLFSEFTDTDYCMAGGGELSRLPVCALGFDCERHGHRCQYHRLRRLCRRHRTLFPRVL